ncbi:MAG: hypothetical protein MK081_02080 [Flavobacteriales bacterium]|nr:hypothetical protein [Flavobacteriales bacterium]
MKRWLAFTIIPVFIVLGFVQEMVKVNVNYYLEQTSNVPGFYNGTYEQRKQWMEDHRIDAPFDYYYSHRPIDWLHHLSLGQLSKLKWGLAVFFIGIHFTLNVLFLRLYFRASEEKQRKQAKRFLPMLYIVSFVLAGIFLVGGKLIGMDVPSYNISRKILGFMQSPMPAILLILLIPLAARFEEQRKVES